MANNLPEVEQFEPLGALNQRRMCAPLQRNLNEVPVVEFDVHAPNLAQLYPELLEKIIRRAERISPGLYYGKPITPHPNPANNPDDRPKGHSYFRVLWISSTDTSVRIEFLIRDYDLYLLGFRRRIREGDWSNWYCFVEDLGWPAFLEGAGGGVSQIWFDGGHENHVKVGGPVTINHIFYTLAYWHENDGQGTMIEALQMAVVFLSEAIRFHWVAQEMEYRIEQEMDPPIGLNYTQFGRLPMWKRIGNWRNFCRVALDTGLTNGIIRTRQALGQTQYDVIYQIHGFMHMMDGLRVLKRNEGSRGLDPQRNQTRIQYGQHVLEPGFIALDEDYPEEPAVGHWWIP